MSVGDRSAAINRPTLVGSLIGKASALLLPGDKGRHLEDFVVLAVLAQPEDFENDAPLNQLDAERLAHAIGVLRRDRPTIIGLVDGAEVALDRLAMFASRSPKPPRTAPHTSPEWSRPVRKRR